MENQFVPVELSIKLKEIGFDAPCMACYTYPSWLKGQTLLKAFFVNSFKEFFNSKLKIENISAPLWQQAFDWFESEYGLSSYIEPVIVDNANSRIHFDYVILQENGITEIWDNLPYHTKEDAKYACLKKLIQLYKKQYGRRINIISNSTIS